MERAILLARQAEACGEVPVGAVVVADEEIVGEGFNQVISNNDPTAHAEIVALRAAAARCSNYRLPDTRLYVTIEPCTMCVGAIMHTRIATLIFGATEPRAGAVISQAKLEQAGYFNHRVEIVGGVLAEQCSALLTSFFRVRRLAK